MPEQTCGLLAWTVTLLWTITARCSDVDMLATTMGFWLGLSLRMSNVSGRRLQVYRQIAVYTFQSKHMTVLDLTGVATA